MQHNSQWLKFVKVSSRADTIFMWASMTVKWSKFNTGHEILRAQSGLL